MILGDVSRDTFPIIRQGVCECVCVIFMCLQKMEYFRVNSDWLTFVADLYESMLCGGPFWTQSDNVVILAVVFFSLLSRSISFQIFGNLKDILLI